ESGTDEDFVDVLLKFHNNDDLGFSLTGDNVKAVIWDIFTAGSETSATAVDWAMVEMIRNPRVMRKVQDEVREVFRRKGSVDETGISEMKYLKTVVKETLRLHPPAPLLLPRECGEKCEINGYEIPAKTRIIVNAWAIGRDPKYWTDPESFMPERFLDSSIDHKGNNFEYIPFGAGRRICPGISFGLINVELPLALLLCHFDWQLPSGMKNEDLDMTELFGVTVRRKEDLHMIPIA
ncbi:Cytochrome P450, E-class, group I, partial [Trema orientale]